MNKKLTVACLSVLAGSLGFAGGFSIKVTSGKALVAAEGGETILVFSEDARVQVDGSGTADILVVGGGGGGGAKWGGGGGGGGVVYKVGEILASGPYDITVGAGGLGAEGQGAAKKPTSGESSSFGSIIALGGGAGGTYDGSGVPPTGYASGGGAGCLYPADPRTIKGAAGTDGQGHAGGASIGGSNAFWTQGGGGGGAGENGEAGRCENSQMLGSCGGDGLLVPIYGEKYYGGGGGGGGANQAASGTGIGGLGGGGAGAYGYSTAKRGLDGEPGTGGGGGGGSGYDRDKTLPDGKGGGDGGSGIVIVRYRPEIELPEAGDSTGGVKSFSDGTIIHRFTEDGSLVLSEDVLADVLIVGGGGGGGIQAGGGGGAGGVIMLTNVFYQAGTYPVVVGAGGVGAKNFSGNSKSSNGGDSSFVGCVALGGGAGGSRDPLAGNPQIGGSGGGAGAPYYAYSTAKHDAAAGTPGQGYGGGVSTNDTSISMSARRAGGGGGGGASEPGHDAAGSRDGGSGYFGGNGGDGVICDFDGTVKYYGGGGGGGGSTIGGSTENGGLGGGGKGGCANGSGTTQAGANGEPGTGGGGGGGGGYGEAYSAGGAGGSGIVIVRYRLKEPEIPDAIVSSGGQIRRRGGHVMQTFSESGTFTLDQNVRMDFLIVGGGGGGGLQAGGGGGAGGVLVYSNVFMLAGTYDVTVGAGGVGAKNFSGNSKSSNGGDSSFAGCVALGGGAGGSRDSSAGYPQVGASGGGAAAPYFAYESETHMNPAAGTPGQGYGGGVSTNDQSLANRQHRSGGGGGGGAGAPGQNAGDAPLLSNRRAGGEGGMGILCDFSGAEKYYGGGGGGGGVALTEVFGNGGLGGGGSGAGNNYNGVPHAGLDGEPGTGGGGGGGGGFGDSVGVGGAGGSGIVIIRYAVVPSGLMLIVQ